jgi:hypothetical protein
VPPVGFFASANSAYTSATGAVTFLTPPAVRENDVLIAILAVPTGALVLAAGWTQIMSTAATNATLYLARRIATSDEPAAHVFSCSTGMATQPLGILVLERGLDPAAAIVTSATLDVAASTAFSAASVTLTTYSDLGVLVYYSNDVAGTMTFAMPANATQRAIVHGSSGGCTLVVADYLSGATGATGAKTATAAAISSGLASNIALKALPTLPAGALIPDIAGALGLPTVGV